jgi:hypothetical protein
MERETAHFLIAGAARSQELALWCGIGREGGMQPRTIINRNWITSTLLADQHTILNKHVYTVRMYVIHSQITLSILRAQNIKYFFAKLCK